MIATQTYSFDLSFLPSVRLQSGMTDHQEVIAKLPMAEIMSSGDSLLALTSGSESSNGDLAIAFDLALCRGVLQLLEKRPQERFCLPISWKSMSSSGFLPELTTLLRAEHKNRQRLILEFVAADDILPVDQASNQLSMLRRLGCRISLSHFGASDASYRFLRYTDVDYVKIDPSFLNCAVGDKRQRKILSEICGVCSELDYRSIACDIDNPRQAEIAVSAGVHLGQGPLYGNPQRYLSETPMTGHTPVSTSSDHRQSMLLH